MIYAYGVKRKYRKLNFSVQRQAVTNNTAKNRKPLNYVLTAINLWSKRKELKNLFVWRVKGIRLNRG